MALNIAVIGAGMSGLVAAKQLKQQDHSVTVFEKARGSGGRLSSKALAIPETDQRVTFDLGCTHFAVKQEAFKNFLAPYVDKETMGYWPEKFQDQSVQPVIGLSRSSALTRSMTEDLDVRFATRITSIQPAGTEAGWELLAEDTVLANVDQVILAVPPEQAKDLLPAGHKLKQQLMDMSDAYLAPQWVMGVVLAEADTALLNNVPVVQSLNEHTKGVLDQLTIESAKPMRAATPVLQLQATVQWTQGRLDWDREQIAEAMLAVLNSVLPKPITPLAVHVHRWLYSHVLPKAQPEGQSDGKQLPPAYLSSNDGLVICGDYFLATGKENGVESAFLSGLAAAQSFAG